MARRHGSRLDHRGSGLGRAITIGVVVLLLATLGLVLAAERYAAMARLQAWTVGGPPCPTAAPADYRAFVRANADRIPASNTFIYDDVRFARPFGYVSCGEVADHAGRGPGTVPVCLFNDPDVVEVTTQRGQFHYMPKTRSVTIVVPDGEPRCVLGARLGFDWLQ